MKRKKLILSAAVLTAVMVLGASSFTNAESLPNVWTGMDPTFPVGLREFPQNNPDIPEIWIYSDKMSYNQGEEVVFFVHTNAKKYNLKIEREGGVTETVHEKFDLKGISQETPENAFIVGAGWEKSYSLKIPQSWKSGVYVISVTAEIPGKGTAEGEHFIVVKNSNPGSTSKIALMLPTSTYTAYNDWGGGNYYRSQGNDNSNTKLSTQRPWAKGFSRLPGNYERHGQGPVLKPFENPRFRNLEWALTNGYSRHYADAGWAYYDSQFAIWAEKQGYELEYITQHDIHYQPDILNNYQLLIVVGHDEYWSWEMRDAVDSFVDKGGNLARFGGNFVWQVRLEDDGETQICYKDPDKDPISKTAQKHLTTFSWEHPIVNRSSAQTVGVIGMAGVYAMHGGAAPRMSGGFTVYRPQHWVFKGTDLYFGDVFGGRPTSIVAYEVDGLDFTFRNGLPEPTYRDGALEGTQILAFTTAPKGEEDHTGGQRMLNSPIEEFEHVTELFQSDDSSVEDGLIEFKKGEGLLSPYGSAMIVVAPRGEGTIFCAGTATWIHGLQDNDYFTEQITRNVLNQLSGRQ